MSELIQSILNRVLSFLPNDPLYSYINSINTGIINPVWLKWLNWLVPVHDFIVVFGIWLTAVLIYLGIKFFIAAFEAFKP